jgi:integrase
MDGPATTALPAPPPDRPASGRWSGTRLAVARARLDLENLRVRIARSMTLVNGVFEVGSPKNGTARTVSLPAFVADLLAPRDLDALVFPDSGGRHMRGSNVRRRWWSQAVAAAELFPHTVSDAAGEETVVYDFKLHELRHTAASLAILGRRQHQGAAEHAGARVGRPHA